MASTDVNTELAYAISNRLPVAESTERQAINARQYRATRDCMTGVYILITTLTPN